jgi:hypothetical protein
MARDERPLRERNTLRNFSERRQRCLALAAKTEDKEVVASLVWMAADLQKEIERLQALAAGEVVRDEKSRTAS